MRWPPSAIMVIAALVVAAAILPAFAGCGGDIAGEGAPSPEPPRASMAPPEPQMRHSHLAEVARHSTQHAQPTHQLPATEEVELAPLPVRPSPAPETAMPPTEQRTKVERGEGGPVETTPEPPSPVNGSAPSAQIAATHSPGGGLGAPPTAAESAAGGAKVTRGGAAQIRLYLARHDIYKSWYPMVGEVAVDPSGVAIVGTSLAAGKARASREICDAVVRSGFVASAEVFYGKDLSHACR